MALSRKAWAGGAITLLVVVTAVVRSAPDGATPFEPVPTREARAFYIAAADAEVMTRKKAEGRFRGSPWSRDDEFHNKEAKFIRAYAKGHRMSFAALVDALGLGMHEGWPAPPGETPDQKVLPCRPRLTY